MRYVALLRGINVGGKNKLPMRALTALFEAAGCRAVSTYIQSGNVIFEARSVAKLPVLIARRIEEAHGLRVPVIVRSAEELSAIARGNPYGDEEGVHVMFLAEAPSAARVAALDPRRSPPDEFTVAGANLYLRLPSGVARTRLTNDYFDRTLQTVSTLRNWRTLQKLVELAARQR
jgi:uncharacterized protein (DUF1697 family)